MNKQVGQTKDVGFQFGVRKSFKVPVNAIWNFMFSAQGVNIWLGELSNELTLNKPYKTKNGIEGFVRVFKVDSHIRLSWKKKKWDNMSLVQLRIYGDSQKSTISFHQEKLASAEQREEVKTHWNGIMNQVSKHFSNE